MLLFDIKILRNIFKNFSKGKINASKKPNVVVIVICSLRADHLPFYGYKTNTAPFLSEISTKSIIFENAYSVSSLTGAATASIFTSVYPSQHGVVEGATATDISLRKIRDEVSTMAEGFKEKGYRTYAVCENVNICREGGFARGFDKFDRQLSKESVINDKLKEWKREIKSRKPYFLFLYYNGPHMPYARRRPWFEEKNNPKLNEISAYDSEINNVDCKIQEMFKFFKWNKNTLLILTADHGEEFYEHGGTGHGSTLYSETLRVPLLIYFSNDDLKGKRIKHNVSIIDILPTLREFIGLPLDTNSKGVSLVPFLKNEVFQYKERFIYSEVSRRKKYYGKDIVRRAVIYGDWHYIYTAPDSEEFFNLKIDPAEKINKINETPEIASLLRTKISEFSE